MAYDLLLGPTKRDWSIGRPSRSLAPLPTSDEVTLRLTQPEMNMLAEIAATKQRADAGDRGARKKVAKLAKKVARLQASAKRGDPAAQRSLRVLKESGALVSVTAMTMGEETIPNVVYRAAVLKQAAKAAGGNKPTTKHFFSAKSAVDKVMGRAGISLYLPGAAPGRVTY
jgi:hypothetical protein